MMLHCHVLCGAPGYIQCSELAARRVSYLPAAATIAAAAAAAASAFVVALPQSVPVLLTIVMKKLLLLIVLGQYLRKSCGGSYASVAILDCGIRPRAL